MNKVAILTYIPTHDQSHDTQTAELVAYAAGKGYQIVEVIQRTFSAVKDDSFRAGTQRLMEKAVAKEINKVLLKGDILLLDYDASRTLNTLNELHRLGVSIVMRGYDLEEEESLGPDGELSNFGRILISALLSYIAAAEERRESIKEGVAEAKRKGKQIGRPAGTTLDPAAILKKYPKVVKSLKEGLSVRHTAKLCGVGVSTVQKIKKLLQAI